MSNTNATVYVAAIQAAYDDMVSTTAQKRAAMLAQIELYKTDWPEINDDERIKALIDAFEKSATVSKKGAKAKTRKAPAGPKCEHTTTKKNGDVVSCTKTANEKYAFEGKQFCYTHTEVPEFKEKRLQNLENLKKSKPKAAEAKAEAKAESDKESAAEEAKDEASEEETEAEDEDKEPYELYETFPLPNGTTARYLFDLEKLTLLDAETRMEKIRFLKMDQVKIKGKKGTSGPYYLWVDEVDRFVYGLDVKTNAWKYMGKLDEEDTLVPVAPATRSRKST